jgi:hypothetical protein
MGYIMRDVNADNKTVTPLFRKERFMQDPIIVDLLSYWESLRAGRIAPMRSEVDPREITGALEHTFVLAYNNSLDVRFRLAGIKLCELMGMELRGMPARALIELGHRDELSRIIDALIDDPKIVELHLRSNANKGGLKARMLLLPMQDQKGSIARILGCLTTTGPNMQHPQRFEIKDVKTTRIIGVMNTTEPQPVTGFAEDTDPFMGPTSFTKPTMPHKADKPRTERLIAGKPYLRLVKDD